MEPGIREAIEELLSPASAGAAPPTPAATPAVAAESCDVCGSDALWWRNCKLVCANCRSIVKSCADL